MHHDSPRVIWVGTLPSEWESPAYLRATSPIQWRGRLVHAGGDWAFLRQVAWKATLAGAVGVLATPTEAPPTRTGRRENWLQTTPMPWWARRFARYVFTTQDEARAFPAPLGRKVVAQNAEDLGNVYTEVWRMHT